MTAHTGRQVVAFGECMLELNGTAFGPMHQTFGGDTLNTAVYLARCASGCTVAYASAVGDDALSEGLVARWQAEGLATHHVRRIAGRLPGLYQISVDAGGERRFSYWRGDSAARAYFDAATTPLEDDAGRIDALYFSGISLAILPPAGRDRLLALAARLAARGAWVVFDNNYRPRLWPDAATARGCWQRALAAASIALVTLDDEMALWGDPDADARTALTLAGPCPEVVIKRGAAPTLVGGPGAGGAALEVPTVPVPRVVDTTAAGDSFAGAYLAARLAGHAPAAAAAAGNRLAARVIQHRGALIPPAEMPEMPAL